MSTIVIYKYKRILNIFAASSLIFSLSGCIVAVPPALQIASMALDGLSYATTGKSVSDHAISKLTSKDCAMTNILKGTDICQGNVVQVATTQEHSSTLAKDTQMEIDALNQDLPDNLDLETASGPTQ